MRFVAVAAVAFALRAEPDLGSVAGKRSCMIAFGEVPSSFPTISYQATAIGPNRVNPRARACVVSGEVPEEQSSAVPRSGGPLEINGTTYKLQSLK